MIKTTLAAYLALNKIDGLGVKQITLFEKNHPNIISLFELSNRELAELAWQEKHIQQWRNLSWKIIEEELTWAEKPDCFILHWHDPQYSRLLREIHRPPVILYIKGQLDALNQQSMAIVGTRHPTPYGKNNAAYFSQKLAEIGFCIVSGLAIGIDGIAHYHALTSPAGTVAVTATGLDQIYPERHKKLAEKIIENGAIISEFPFKTNPRPENFPRRNRIISGLSRGVLVIEAALKSGSLITARYAMEQGREVFAIPGIIQNPQTEGCHALIRQGAVLVHTIENMLEEFDEFQLTQDKQEKNNSQKNSPISSSHSQLISHIDYGNPVSIDMLIERSGLGLNEVISQLFTLELEGVIQKSENNGYFR